MVDVLDTVRNFQADPAELEIAATVISLRAALLPHLPETRDELMQAASDYRWYSRLLKPKSHPLVPREIEAEREPTAPTVVFETDEFVCLGQRVVRPVAGVDHRHFRITHRGQEGLSRFGLTPSASRSLAVVEVIQMPDGRWQVLHAEVHEQHRRQMLAMRLYDEIEPIIEADLHPSGWLSDDAYRFWEARGSFALEFYRQVSDFPGMWISPKALLILRQIALAKLELIRDTGEP